MTSKMAHTSWLVKKILFRKHLIDAVIINPKFSMSTAAKTMKKDDAKSDTTYDKEEVKKFSDQSDIWWNTNGQMKPLHSMNAIRIPLVRDGLVQCPDEKRNPTPLKDLKILDVGCGGGILSEALSKIGAEVTGIDASKDLIEVAQHHSINNSKLIKKPNYLYTTVEDHLNDHKDYYDGVVASEVIEHISNKELFVKSCVGALKPGGRIFFTTENRTRMSQIFGIYVAEYVAKVLPKGTHQYDMFITPNELSFLLERNDCHVELIYGLFYNILLNRWSFVQSQTFMFAMQAQKFKSPE